MTMIARMGWHSNKTKYYYKPKPEPERRQQQQQQKEWDCYCIVCDRGFLRYPNMLKHMRKEHRITKFVVAA